MRMFRMSNVPIAGQPSLSVKAIGVSPSAFICFASAMNWSHVFGTLYPCCLKTLFR